MFLFLTYPRFEIAPKYNMKRSLINGLHKGGREEPFSLPCSPPRCSGSTPPPSQASPPNTWCQERLPQQHLRQPVHGYLCPQHDRQMALGSACEGGACSSSGRLRHSGRKADADGGQRWQRLPTCGSSARAGLGHDGAGEAAAAATQAAGSSWHRRRD